MKFEVCGSQKNLVVFKLKTILNFLELTFFFLVY